MGRADSHVVGWIEAVGQVPGATLRQDDGVTSCVSDIPWPMFNAAVARPDADPAAVATALRHLENGGMPWFLFTMPETPAAHVQAAEALGAAAFDVRAPWMEIPRAELGAPMMPEGIVVEEATDQAGWEQWAATVRDVYEFPEIGETSWVEPARRMDWAPPWRAWTALRDGRGVGCTLLIEAGGVAALLAVGVVPAERRRGVGALMTLLPLAHATEPWCGFWSTPAGMPLYRALGFTERGWMSRWVGNAPIALPDTARG